MWILISLNIIVMGFSLFVVVFGLINGEFNLAISSLSVLAASISGLIAIMVLKDNKDKERPFLIVKPNYNRYGSIQISVENYGTEIAVIKNAKVNNKITLVRGESFFDQIKGATIPPGDSINYILLSLKDYSERNSEFTTKGTIFYENIKGKLFSNDIIFNIEKLGPTSYNDDEERKMFYELQKIPHELNSISKQMKKSLPPKITNEDINTNEDTI